MMSDIDRDRFKKTGMSVGTWFYTCEVTEEEMMNIFRNQYAYNKLKTLVDSMDDKNETIPKFWVKEVLGGIVYNTKDRESIS